MVSTGALRRLWRCSRLGKSFRDISYTRDLRLTVSSQESADSVVEWLTASGIASDRIGQHFNQGWIEVKDTTVSELEDLLQTEYYYFDHEYGSSSIACHDYSVPAALSAEHIDIVMPTVHFDAKVRPSQNELMRKRQKRDLPSLFANTTASLPKPGKEIDINAIDLDLTGCDTQITPDCLRALYNIPTGTLNVSSYGIVEYGFQSYLPDDLDLFFANFSTEQVGERPLLDSVDGGAPQTLIQTFSFNGESDLDLQYAMVSSNSPNTSHTSSPTKRSHQPHRPSPTPSKSPFSKLETTKNPPPLTTSSTPLTHPTARTTAATSPAPTAPTPTPSQAATKPKTAAPTPRPPSSPPPTATTSPT